MSTTHILPLELITIISRLLDSAADLLSLSLVCHRHHNIILSQIKEKNNSESQILLNLYTRKILSIGEKPYGQALVYIFHCLPDCTAQGEIIGWVMPTGSGVEKFKDESAANYNMRLHKAGSAESFEQNSMAYIISPQKQQQIEEKVKNGGCLYHKSYRHFGVLEGWSRDYGYTGYVRRACQYRDGNLHGDLLAFGLDGELQLKATYFNNKRNGLCVTYSCGQICRKQFFKGDLSHGEEENFSFVGDFIYPVLWQRCSYVDGNLDGISEHWDLETGIRKWVCHFRNAKQVGVEEVWDETTGMKKSITTYRQGTVVSSIDFTPKSVEEDQSANAFFENDG